jgi:hypothetical protein
MGSNNSQQSNERDNQVNGYEKLLSTGSVFWPCGVCRMRTIFALILLLTLCVVVFAESIAISDSSAKFQQVGGDYGKSWINNLKDQNPIPADQGKNATLWGWGNMPKGKELVGGKLIDAPNTTWIYNNPADWIGNNYVDPYTGQPIYKNYQVFPDYSTKRLNQLPGFLRSSNANIALDPWAV